jgi:hypothetical protein
MSVMRERLGQFCVIVVRFLFGTQPDSPIVQEFERIEWNLPPRAIKMVVSDVVEWSRDLTGEQLMILDSQLASEGLPTLSAMRNANYRTAIAVLDRGAVRNQEEWHILNALVSDTADRTLSTVERQQAERLLSEYRRE